MKEAMSKAIQVAALVLSIGYLLFGIVLLLFYPLLPGGVMINAVLLSTASCIFTLPIIVVGLVLYLSQSPDDRGSAAKEVMLVIGVILTLIGLFVAWQIGQSLKHMSL
jgi:hypothetical protein